MAFDKKPFPVRWGDEGVDVSRDEFVKRWGKQKDPQKHVGANFKVDLPGAHRGDGGFINDMSINSPGVKKFICMVGKCSGVINEKPKED
jgi:hypothetical protein